MKKLVCILTLSLLLTGCYPRPESPVPPQTAGAESGSGPAVDSGINAASGSASATEELDSVPNLRLEDQTYYSDFISNQKENFFSVSGTIHQNRNIKGLIKAEVLKETDLTVSGSLTCAEGTLKLLCRRPDGTEITIAEGIPEEETSGKASGAEEDDKEFSVTIKAAPGTNFFYFSGTDAVCDFNLDFSLSESASYYMTTSIPPDL